MSQTYRWNVADHAAGYDAAAEHIHPHYVEIQDAILDEIARPADEVFLLVDLGGGSGRLAERFLARFPHAKAVVVDQSESFLEIARRRMEPFGDRGTCVVSRLQDDWAAELPSQAAAIVSMSAIHHLAPEEKQRLYARAYEALAPYGVLLNGDEVRADDDAEYLAELKTWAQHMQRIVAAGRVSEAMEPMLEKWRVRNIDNFDQPRESGDDCHESVQTQLSYLCDCGFRSVGTPWKKEMWALLKGVK